MWVVLMMAAVMLGVAFEGTGNFNEEEEGAPADAGEEATDEPPAPSSAEPDPVQEGAGSEESDEDAGQSDPDGLRTFLVGSNDIVTGTDGDDVFVLEDGADTLEASDGGPAGALAGPVNVNGGAGDDLFLLNDPTAFMAVGGGTVMGGMGDDRIVLSGSDLVIDGGDGNDRIETPAATQLLASTIQGGAGDDIIDIEAFGGSTDEMQVFGGAGSDDIDIRGSDNLSAFGEEGDDTIRIGTDLPPSGTGYVTEVDGGAGSDLIAQDADIRASSQWDADGSFNSARVSGGSGADIFQLTTVTSDGAYGSDGDSGVPISVEWMSIGDFEVGSDMIVLDLSSLENGPYTAGRATLSEDLAEGETQLIVSLTADTAADQEIVITIAATGLDWDDVSFVGATPSSLT